jgi:glucosamine 6-phosphate synthetase-like amidotransferase/phosphosugar isomerase protein
MCCLFGLIDYGNCLSAKRKEKIVKVLSAECEARGTDATGVAYLNDNHISIFKRPLPAHKMHFKFKSNPMIIMGHTRMTTQGSELINANNHPFYSEKLGFALAHNGVLYNDETLRKSEKLPKTKIQTDSYIAVQLIDSKNTLDFNSLKFMAEKVEGSFCFTILSQDNELYIVKGDNPMAIARFDGYYIYASTEAILKKALKRLNLRKFEMVEIDDGEIFKFDTNGSITKSEFEMKFNYTFPTYRWRSSFTKTKSVNKSFNDEYLEDLLYYASFIGVDEDVVMSMVKQGYRYLDIEEMLYEAESYGLEDDWYVEL